MNGTTFRNAVAALALAVLAGGTARAQPLEYEPIGEGVHVGGFILYPAMVFDYAEDSNIYFTSSDTPGAQPTGSGIVSVGPRILADLPFGDSRMRVLYAPYYRDYTEKGFSGGMNHLFDLDADFLPGHLFSFRLRDHYVRGTLSLQDVGARNGLTYGLGDYVSHTPSLEAALNLGLRHTLSVIPSWGDSSFIQAGPTPVSRPVEYGFTTRRLEGRYGYRWSEPTTFYAYTATDDTLQTQSRRDDVTIKSDVIGVGMSRTLTERLTTSITLGYETMSFEGVTGEDFSGPVFDAALNLMVSDGTRMEFGVLRQPYASVFFNNNYYIATELRGRIIRQLGMASYWDALARVADYQYVPRAGEARRDGSIRLEGGIGHMFLRNLRGYAGVDLEYHQSNVRNDFGAGTIDPFQYHVERMIFRLEVGWL